MTIHKTCLGCKWEDYPICKGTIMEDGLGMNIENLSDGFNCGQKDMDIILDYSIKFKSELELKIEELEAKNQEILDRLNELEAQKL